MVLVGGTYRNDDVSQTEVQLRTEGFLNPELFEGYFAAPFDFAFVFASFFGLYLYGAFSPSVFEFDFCSQGPAFSEIVAQEKDYMGKIEAAMLLVLVFLYVLSLVAQVIVTVEIAAVNGFSVSADGEA